MTDDQMTVSTVLNRARQRGVVFATTRDNVGTLTVRWQPPRALTRDEAQTLFRAGTSALAQLLDDDQGDNR